MSLDLVTQVRARYGTPLTPEQCVKVCNEVAYRLNGQTGAGPWGLHQKGGSNWQGYALDIVVNRDTQTGYDVLRDAEGAGAPQWAVVSGAWVWAPVRLEWLPGVVTPPPVPPTPPTTPPTTPPSGDLEARVAALEARFRQAGQIMGAL